MSDMKNEQPVDFEESAWFIGTLVAVALVSSAVLIASVWSGMLGGAAR